MQAAALSRPVFAEDPHPGHREDSREDAGFGQHESGLLGAVVMERRAAQVEQGRDGGNDALASEILRLPEEPLSGG